MNLKYLAFFSLILVSPSGASDVNLSSWEHMDDAQLRQFAIRLGDRFDPVATFGIPISSRSESCRVRIYTRGTRDILVVETKAAGNGTSELEEFHAVRLKRAFEVTSVGFEAGAVRTVWEVCTRQNSAPVKLPLRLFAPDRKEDRKEAPKPERFGFPPLHLDAPPRMAIPGICRPLAEPAGDWLAC